MTAQKITVENCRYIVKDKFVRRQAMEGQARAWQTVFDYCVQNGLDVRQDEDLSGIEKVIKFIETNLKK
jgi:hypothetical protein